MALPKQGWQSFSLMQTPTEEDIMTQPSAEEAPTRPEPVKHCVLCANLATSRRLAEANGHAGSAADLNVRLRRHLRDAHPFVSEDD